MVRLFIGCRLTSEMRMYLKESRAWKQMSIAPMQERDLIETHYQQKDYLGHFFSEDCLPLEKLKESEKRVKEAIAAYCPKLQTEQLNCSIFPQIFLP
jgi:hypothetical protein